MNLKDFITKQTSNRYFDEFGFLLPDSYKGNFIKFLDDYEVALKEEYASNDIPKYCTIKDVDFLIPASYNVDVDTFLDDISYFQNNENHKYKIHNACNKNNQIEQKDIVLGVTVGDNDNYPLHFITPLKMAKRQASKEDIELELMKKMVARYMTAYTKTCRLNEDHASEQKEIQDKIDSSKEGKTDDKVLGLFNKSEHKLYTSIKSKTSDKKRPISLSQSYFSYCNNEHSKHIAKITAMRLGSALKWSAKQTADVALGLLGSPLFAAYKLLDKKYHWEENKFSHFLDKQIAPKIKKALLTTAITTTTVLGGKYSENISQFAEDVKTERAERKDQAIREQQEKEAFFKKYDTTDEVFYQNYKTAKENEAMIVALIACYEGFRENAYLCEAGKLTIGNGNTRTVLRDNDGNILRDDKGFAITRAVKEGDVTTKEAAFEDLIAHLDKYVYAQFKHINRVLEDQEIAAVCMFIYNTDEGAFKGSMLCIAINSNASDEKVREAFSIIRSVNGNRSYGLIKRHGFEGYIFCCENMEDLINLKPTIAGSPDIKYYEYSPKDKKNPLENPDKTFITRNIEDVKKDVEKFKTNDFKKCIVYMLPLEKAKEVLKKYGFHVDENGKIKTDISWEEAQKISSKHNKKSAKKLKLQKHKSR